MVAQIFALLVTAQLLFGKSWFPGDLKDFQTDLKKNADAVNEAVKACSTVGPEMRALWTEFYTRLSDFAATDFGWLSTTSPDGSLHIGGGDRADIDRGLELAKELYEWGQKIESQSCKLLAPNPEPPKDTTGLSPQVATVIKYGAVAAGFLSAAYIVGQVASTVRLFKGPARA